MRRHDNELSENEAEGFFHNDIPGGCEVECSKCKSITPVKYSSPEWDDWKCNNCERYLVYRPWWEW